ncbi:MAG: CmcJ/NvfI family oxidoreductase [Gammaproteobacteria bacterium]|nr:CmcJ/NvfI family oxidoreductase [Gammaproteobacteria bacterium]
MAVLADVRYLNAEWRDRDEIPVVGDRESRRANTAKHAVEIHDARPGLAEGELTLDVNGFALLHHESSVRNFRDDEEVRRVYYPEVVALAKRKTGAREVIITQHVVRTEDTSDFNKAYARFVHCDYTLADPRDLAQRALARRELTSRDYVNSDFAWFNSWQPFDHAVARNPLAVVDASTVKPEYVLDYYYTGYGQKGKSGMPVQDPRHRFYYVSNMTTDELLLIKQLDTRDGMSKVCPHTSFDDPTSPPEAPPRRSIEVRMIAVFGH